MPKKSTASKPLPPNYIAFDDDQKQVIVIGTKEQVIEAIQEYTDYECWDEDGIVDFIMVYELGKKIDLSVSTKVEIYF